MNWLSGGRNGYLRCKKALLRHDDEIGVFFEVSRCHGLNDCDFVICPHRLRARALALTVATSCRSRRSELTHLV